MKKRNSPYKLSGPETGELSPAYYEYIDKFFASEILNEFCDAYAGHSYWLDNKIDVKSAAGEKIKNEYPDKKFEMSEWCELPLKIDSTTIDSGLYMANIIIQDLNLLGAVSWQSWTAVNGDGVLDRVDGELVTYYRYYAYKQFSSFIKPGMTRIKVMDSLEENSKLACVAFRNAEQTVIVIVNNSEESENINLAGFYKNETVYRTDAENNCSEIYSGEFESKTQLPAKSITTFILED
jgi:O-glycosyl hydrolase